MCSFAVSCFLISQVIGCGCSAGVGRLSTTERVCTKDMKYYMKQRAIGQTNNMEAFELLQRKASAVNWQLHVSSETS